MWRQVEESAPVRTSAASENSRTVHWSGGASEAGPASSWRKGSASATAITPVAQSAAASRCHFLQTETRVHAERKMAKTKATYRDSPTAEASARAAGRM